MCDRTPGTCARGERWSAARIKTTATNTCIPLCPRWCRQVSCCTPVCWSPQRPVGRRLWPWLALSPSNEKHSRSPGPASVSCLGMDVRRLSIGHLQTRSVRPCVRPVRLRVCLSRQTTGSGDNFYAVVLTVVSPVGGLRAEPGRSASQKRISEKIFRVWDHGGENVSNLFHFLRIPDQDRFRAT